MTITYQNGSATFIKDSGLVNREKQLRTFEQFIRLLRKQKIAYQITSL